MRFTRHVRQSLLSALALAAAAPLPLCAQSGKPVAAQTTAPVDALERPARLSVRDVPLAHALTELYERSGVPVSFSPSLLPRITVSCDCDTVPVARALERLLSKSGLLFRDIDGHVLVYRPSPIDVDTRLQVPSRYAALSIPKSRPGLSVGTAAALKLPRVGTISGTVTESETGEPVVNAQIAVDGAGRAFTDSEGRYRITNVPPGRRSVSVTSIGYTSTTRDVDVVDGATVAADFVLAVSPSKLDEVVVTVTGEQRVRELGHVVARINVDSLVREAPVSNITEILTGRIPGLQVFQTQGIVGGDVQLQIRTPNSMLLSAQPIVIMDGVRYTSTPALDQARRSGTRYGESFILGGDAEAARVEATSPLNDLNPNDIETIEVVKGSAAATLYGTDASNGVIVITTKRGHEGPARWNAYVRGGINETPRIAQPDSYFGWGTQPDGLPFQANCSLYRIASGACAQDSITVVSNPLNDPSQTIFANAPQWEYGLNASGGGAGVQYYIGGSLQRQVGSLRMPAALADSIEEARGAGMAAEQYRPNALTNINLRSNLTAAFGEEVQLQGNIGYVRRKNRTIAVSNPYLYAAEVQWQDPKNPWGGQYSPDRVFSRTSVEQVDRFLFNASAEWRPTSWLNARMAAGVDLTNGARHSLERRGETSSHNTGAPLTGEVQNDRTQQRTVSGDVGLTASYGSGRVNLRTSVGAQYAHTTDDVQVAWGTDLIPGGESVSQATNRFADHVFSETATLGAYAEQMVGLNNRLFLTGAVRMDGASAFGRDYRAAAYPKVSLSWLVSEEPFVPSIPGLDELRLRYAFGASGQQAHPWMALPTFTTSRAPVYVEGTLTTLINVASIGNEHLRPERVREHEFGFDVAALGHRMQIGLAWYRRRTVDQIAQQALPPGLGFMYRNLGLTTARGFEASVSANVIESRHLSWDVSMHHSTSSTLLVDIGDGIERTSSGYKEGFPLGGRFLRPVLGYEDVNGDGIIVSSEMQLGDTAVYVGQGTPPRSQTLSTAIGFLDRRVRVSASLNRTAGQILSQQGPCNNLACREMVDPSTPLEEQAMALAVNLTPIQGDFIRLREVTTVVELPPELLNRVGIRSGNFSVSARNLALWTDFRGGDPESIRVTGLRRSGTQIPQARSWTFRFDVGF